MVADRTLQDMTEGHELPEAAMAVGGGVSSDLVGQDVKGRAG
jgi:hypothetical protein